MHIRVERGQHQPFYARKMSDADVAIRAASAGASLIRRRYGTSLVRISKSETDFATDVDVAAEQAIITTISQARPCDAIRGEELGVSGPAASSRVWLVDPLCGTLNFTSRTPGFSVNVALMDGDETRAAAVADPLSDHIYWTDSTTAWRRDTAGDVPLAPTADSNLVDINLDTADPDSHGFSPSQLLRSAAFERLRPRVLSTTLALTWVATGQRAGYLTSGNLRRNVHFASAIAICQAAGCITTNLLGGPLHTGIGGLIAAADASTHSILLESVTKHILRE
jgi:myo-inositol-1(or 4)-monophosphatase